MTKLSAANCQFVAQHAARGEMLQMCADPLRYQGLFEPAAEPARSVIKAQARRCIIELTPAPHLTVVYESYRASSRNLR